MTIKDKIAALPPMPPPSAFYGLNDSSEQDYFACVARRYKAERDLALKALCEVLADYQKNAFLREDYQEWGQIWNDLPDVIVTLAGGDLE